MIIIIILGNLLRSLVTLKKSSNLLGRLVRVVLVRIKRLHIRYQLAYAHPGLVRQLSRSAVRPSLVLHHLLESYK